MFIFKVGTEMNTSENTSLLMAHHQNPEQNHALKTTNKFSQNNNKAQAFQTDKIPINYYL
jgi:hypothetical protein